MTGATLFTLEQRMHLQMSTVAFTDAVVDNLGRDRWDWITPAPEQHYRTAPPSQTV